MTISNTGTNSFTGAVAINTGTVRLAGGTNRLPTSAAVTLADDPTAVLDLNNNNQMIGSLSGGGASGGNVTLGSATLGINSGSGVYNGVISGGGGVVQNGGTQTFGGANLYSGGTVILGGTLIVTNADGSSGVGTGPVTVQTNGYLQIGNGGPSGSIAAGTITDNGYVVIDRSDNLTFSTLLVGSGGFTKEGTDTVTITNANTYSGPTTISQDALAIQASGALGDVGLLTISSDNTAVLTLQNGVTLANPIYLMRKGGGGLNGAIDNLGGTNILTGPMTFDGGGTYWNVQSDAGDLILKGSFAVASVTTGASHLRLVSNGGNGEWYGNINDEATGQGETTQVGINGPGTWTLWGTNGYSGGTSINSGQLNVNGSLTANAAVTVGNGSALGASLSGSGSIAGPVTIAASATLCGVSVTASGNPSGCAAARLTLSNSLSLDHPPRRFWGYRTPAATRSAGCRRSLWQARCRWW